MFRPTNAAEKALCTKDAFPIETIVLKKCKNYQNFQNFAKASGLFVFFIPSSRFCPKKSPEKLRPWKFHFLQNLRPSKLEMSEILHPWYSEMPQISQFSHWNPDFAQKKKAKFFRPPSAADVIFLHPWDLWKPKFLPPWHPENLKILRPYREEGIKNPRLKKTPHN